MQRRVVVRNPDPARDDVRDLARRHHVHYDVDPLVVISERGRQRVGYQVRLWGVYPKGAHPLPGYHAHVGLADDLARIADTVVPEKKAEARAVVGPALPGLYDSRVVPGADEIALPIRLLSAGAYLEPAGPEADRSLKEIREGLKALGIPERS